MRGQMVVKGTRVTVRTLLASLAEGASVEEILSDFPTVSAPAMRAVIAFAAQSAEDDIPMPPVPVFCSSKANISLSLLPKPSPIP